MFYLYEQCLTNFRYPCTFLFIKTFGGSLFIVLTERKVGKNST